MNSIAPQAVKSTGPGTPPESPTKAIHEGSEDFAKLLKSINQDEKSEFGEPDTQGDQGKDGKWLGVEKKKAEVVLDSTDPVLLTAMANVPPAAHSYQLPEAILGEIIPAAEDAMDMVAEADQELPIGQETQVLDALIPSELQIGLGTHNLSVENVASGNSVTTLGVPSEPAPPVNNSGTFLPGNDGKNDRKAMRLEVSKGTGGTIRSVQNEAVQITKSAGPMAAAGTQKGQWQEVSEIATGDEKTVSVKNDQHLERVLEAAPEVVVLPAKNDTETTPKNFAGTLVAKQVRVMTDTDLQRLEKSPSAELSTVEKTPSLSVSMDGLTPVKNAQSDQAQRDADPGLSDDAKQEGVPFQLPALKEETFVKTAVALERPSESSHVMAHLAETLTRMHEQGTQHVELRLPLQDGGEVLVKLQISHGEVKAVFQTESDGLKQALQNDWSNFAQRNEERSIKMGSAVFESPGAQSGENSFQNPQDRRGQPADETANLPNYISVPLRRGGQTPVGISRTTTESSKSSSLRIYA